MEKIASFTIDHNKMKRGIYVSRKDHVGEETITTFDLRLKEPNREPVIDNPALHTIEHLGATFLRNEKSYKDKVIYFGPMGCRTGCYLLLAGDLESKQIVDLIKDLFEFIRDYEGEIPGAKPKDCGNFSEQNLTMAKWESEKYLNEILYKITDSNLYYPE